MTRRDVRALPYMPLLVDRLLGSVTWKMATGDEAKAMVNLWACAWKELPGGSVPAGERELAALSGAGANWPAVREVALRGFVLGEDGRLHHPVIVGLVDDALASMEGQQTRTAKARAALKAKRERDRERDRHRHNVSNSHCHNERNSIQREQELNPPVASQQTPLSQPPKTAGKAKAPPKPKVAIPEWVPVDLWAEWRRVRGPKLTDEAVRRQLTRLQDLRAKGYDVREVIGNALEAGWATFYEPKAQARDYRNGTDRSSTAAKIVEDAYGKPRSADEPEPVAGEWTRIPEPDA